jgi:hypothetical protein
MRETEGINKVNDACLITTLGSWYSRWPQDQKDHKDLLAMGTASQDIMGVWLDQAGQEVLFGVSSIQCGTVSTTTRTEADASHPRPAMGFSPSTD